MRITAIYLPLALALAVSGCAREQLNNNTAGLGETVEDVTEDQVAFNVGRFIDDSSAIPSQVQVPSGSATVTNSVQPSISFPLTSSGTSTHAPSGTTHGTTIGGASASLSGSDSWQQTWTMTAITDPDTLQRLRALYRYATGGIDTCEFYAEYPIQISTDTSAISPLPYLDASSIFDEHGALGSEFEAKGSGKLESKLCSETPSKFGLNSMVTRTGTTDQKFDLASLASSSCVICDVKIRGVEYFMVNPDLLALSRNAPGHQLAQEQKISKWLVQHPVGVRPLNGEEFIVQAKSGSYYEQDGTKNNFHNLVLFVTSAMQQGSSGGGGGGGRGSQKNFLYVIPSS